MVPTKELQLESKEIAGPKDLNLNCWLVRSIDAPPLKRCRYCKMRFKECPAFRYLIITLFLIAISLSTIFLIEGEISIAVILSLFLFIVSYGYFFNKSTEGLILANFSLRKTKKTLEESKLTLEITVKARTEELRELTNSLQQQVKERTKELQERVNELEKFRKSTVGRELKMMELKDEIRRLKEESGK